MDLYLDMFTDTASLDNYTIANNNLDIDSDECVKFSQVYKNNLDDIDDSNMVDGNVYKHLSDKIKATFGANQDIKIVDAPSIEVKRIEQTGDDTFEYNVLMDVHIMQNKDWMENHSSSNNKFVIANAIVKDMRCRVKFTPKYDASTGAITYSYEYSVEHGTSENPYVVEYNQIVYNYNGKTKSMTTSDVRTIPNVVFGNDIILKYSSLSDESINNITKEIISNKIS